MHYGIYVLYPCALNIFQLYIIKTGPVQRRLPTPSRPRPRSYQGAPIGPPILSKSGSLPASEQELLPHHFKRAAQPIPVTLTPLTIDQSSSTLQPLRIFPIVMNPIPPLRI